MALYDREDRVKLSEDFHFIFNSIQFPNHQFPCRQVNTAVFNIDTETAKSVFLVIKVFHIHSGQDSPYMNYILNEKQLSQHKNDDEERKKLENRFLEHLFHCCDYRQPFGIWMYPVFQRRFDVEDLGVLPLGVYKDGGLNEGEDPNAAEEVEKDDDDQTVSVCVEEGDDLIVSYKGERKIEESLISDFTSNHLTEEKAREKLDRGVVPRATVYLDNKVSFGGDDNTDPNTLYLKKTLKKNFEIKKKRAEEFENRNNDKKILDKLFLWGGRACEFDKPSPFVAYNLKKFENCFSESEVIKILQNWDYNTTDLLAKKLTSETIQCEMTFEVNVHKHTKPPPCILPNNQIIEQDGVTSKPTARYIMPFPNPLEIAPRKTYYNILYLYPDLANFSGLPMGMSYRNVLLEVRVKDNDDSLDDVGLTLIYNTNHHSFDIFHKPQSSTLKTIKSPKNVIKTFPVPPPSLPKNVQKSVLYMKGRLIVCI
jgi:hypothetical protein